MTTLDLGDLAFYWRMRSPSDPPSGVPAFLPFELTFTPELQLIRQVSNAVVNGHLADVYKRNVNVGYLQEGHALAHLYGDDFVDFVAGKVPPASPRSVLEIGCGGCFLLKELRARGCDVTGIDPSPVAAVAAKAAGIPLIQDFYPARTPMGTFDLICHYDVLEHIEDPVAFLRTHHEALAPGGVIAFAVPDCSENVALGDVSRAIHEHLNYFDEESLEIVVRAAGFTGVKIRRSGHGGVLFCSAVRASAGDPPVEPRAGTSKFETYARRAAAAIERFRAVASTASSSNELGIYVPLGAFAYLGPTTTDGIRFFDDDPGVHGKLFDGYDVAVENLEDLAARPPASVVVMSLAFGDKIAGEVREATDGRCSTLTLRQLLIE